MSCEGGRRDLDDMTDRQGERQAAVLSQALPYMQAYEGKKIVIKYGGHAMGDADLGRAFARDIALLRQAGIKPIVIHGGGPQIGDMLERVGIKSRFRGGLRITDKPTVEIVEMVLAGSLNKKIVADMNAQGARAIGLSGKDGNMVTAVKARQSRKEKGGNLEKALDLGFVGEPAKIDPTVLERIIDSDLIPVIAPLALGKDGETYNINADTFAGAIASAMKADRLLFLTDVPGVMDGKGKLIRELTVKQARDLMKRGIVKGGMIPKTRTSIDALKKGVGGVAIVNGKTPHAVLLELFTQYGAGTLIVP